MAEIDSLGSNLYYSGVQNAANQALRKNKKAEETKSVKKSKFGDLIHKSDIPEPEFSVVGMPAEISTMTIEEAAVFLKDAVDNAGNDLSEEANEENIRKFKSAVSQFLKFVVNNNYSVKSHSPRFSKPVMSSPFFSNYSLPPHQRNPRYQIEVINEKLAKLSAATIEGQKSNLLLLAQIDEIKGLIIDLMSY